VPFFRLHDRRYTVYFDLITEEERARREAAAAEERARLAALEARTIDRVEPGVEASEAATPEGGAEQHGRRRLRTAHEDALARRARRVVPVQDEGGSGAPHGPPLHVLGREVGARVFDILVDGTVVATTPSTEPSRGLLRRDLPLPPALTAGKSEVTVRFEAHAGNTAGGLFGLRIVGRR